MLHSENTFQQHKIKVVLKSVNYLKFSVKTVGRKIGLRENCIIFIPFNAIFEKLFQGLKKYVLGN